MIKLLNVVVSQGAKHQSINQILHLQYFFLKIAKEIDETYFVYRVDVPGKKKSQNTGIFIKIYLSTQIEIYIQIERQ